MTTSNQSKENRNEVAQTSKFIPMELSQIKERLEYVEEFVKDILVETKDGGAGDYGKLPGIGRPCLFKSGAEKLQFAFNLEATYDGVEETFEPFREWTYEKIDRQTGDIVQVPTRGFYRHKVRCTLTNRSTGEKWGSAIGDCDSTERGRETAPSNTVLKMAEKRAHIAAVLNATFTSDRFTQDVEDYKGDQRPGGDPKHPDPGIAAKYATQCTVCGKKHPVGTKITKHGTAPNGKQGYAAVACVAKMNEANDNLRESRTEHGMTRQDASDAAGSTNDQSDGESFTITKDTPLTMIVDKAISLETMVIEMVDPEFSPEPIRARLAGNESLLSASRSGVINYYNHLVEMIDSAGGQA